MTRFAHLFAPVLLTSALAPSAASAAQTTPTAPAFSPVPPATTPAPADIVAAAPAGDWVAIAPEELMVLTLAPDRDGRTRRVVIQLMPPPFSQGHVGNIRRLLAAHWWDGTSINRVQDNYVVQWGDATEAKPLPTGLMAVPERDYDTEWRHIPGAGSDLHRDPTFVRHLPFARQADGSLANSTDGSLRATDPTVAGPADLYADGLLYYRGWPIATDNKLAAERQAWPVHCYGMVGVGRNNSPDTGTGAELYTVIGHAPRHLDRNIALVGRVIDGMEQLSSLPRGTGALGFYERADERVPIVSARLASELPAAERPRFEYLSTDSASFRRYADAKANRHDAFFIRPAGVADVCNVPVPIRHRSK